MQAVELFILAVIQGITEFLPISSSAHLILPSVVLGWPDQGLAFDTSVHFGSLMAVVLYFRSDITSLTTGLFAQWFQRSPNPDGRFAVHLIIASLPIIPVGYFARFLIEQELRSALVIAGTTIVFGVALYLADRTGSKTDEDGELNIKSALLIGCAQCLALIPGTSRSGITITAALLAGFTRKAAARISFLISIPAISGAAFIKTWDLLQQDVAVNWGHLLIGAATAGVCAYICIKLFLDYITQIGFLPFVIYRLILGSILLVLFL